MHWTYRLWVAKGTGARKILSGIPYMSSDALEEKGKQTRRSEDWRSPKGRHGGEGRSRGWVGPLVGSGAGGTQSEYQGCRDVVEAL